MGSDPMIAAVREALAPIGGAPADAVRLSRLAGDVGEALFGVEAGWGSLRAAGRRAPFVTRELW